jgi:hypothetical protein
MLSQQAALVNEMHAHDCVPLLPIADFAPLIVVRDFCLQPEQKPSAADTQQAL